MKNYLSSFLLLGVINCQDGPKAALNENFIYVDASKPLPFDKIAGVYLLDGDSKKRYNIKNEVNLKLEIEPNKNFIAYNYIDPKTHLVYKKNLKSFFTIIMITKKNIL